MQNPGSVSEGNGRQRIALSAENREHWRGQWTYWRLMARGAAWLGWLLLTHGGEVRRFRQPEPAGERYQRPPRRYDLPPYEEGMSYCRSKLRFLRPTRFCNSRAPEVIALAHSLGAYRVSEAEFAEAAFAFAKERVVFEIGPIVPVEETLHIALRDYTERAIKAHLKVNSGQGLGDVEQIADDWMAVEEAIVGGLVHTILPQFLRTHVHNFSDNLVDEDIDSKMDFRQYRHLRKGIEIVKEIGGKKAVKIYKEDPWAFKELLT